MRLSPSGKAPSFQVGIREFESRQPLQCGGVAQMVRALACHARGRGFDPRHPRHIALVQGTRPALIRLVCGERYPEEQPNVPLV